MGCLGSAVAAVPAVHRIDSQGALEEGQWAALGMPAWAGMQRRILAAAVAAPH